jgi:acyl-lipid omega-6 desaturase (Delta-12 desaturase)
MSTGAVSSVAAKLRAVALRFQRAAPRVALGQIGTTLLPLVAMVAAMHAGLAHG